MPPSLPSPLPFSLPPPFACVCKNCIARYIGTCLTCIVGLLVPPAVQIGGLIMSSISSHISQCLPDQT